MENARSDSAWSWNWLRLLMLAAALAWTMFLFWGLVAPAETVRQFPFRIWDKAAHFLLFFPFGILWLAALALRPAFGLLVVAAGWGIGALTEVLQNEMTKGRHGELWDFVADAGAVLFAWALYYLIVRLRRRTR